MHRICTLFALNLIKAFIRIAWAREKIETMKAAISIKNFPLPAVPAGIIMAGAVMILAADPIVWLVRSWLDPAYDSSGEWIFGVTAGLFLWSLTSPRMGRSPKSKQTACLLLGLSAALRLAGQVLAVNIIGAVLLALDVYALGILAGLAERKRSLSPFWLAVFFALSLPIERLLQRILGHGLQLLSARGTAAFLSLFFPDVSGQGVKIILAGREVFVDLPCSGARALMTLVLLFAFLMAAARPSRKQAAVCGLAALLSAYISNVLRITILALGLAFPEKIGGLDVMAEPWHTAIGLLVLALGAGPILWLAGSIKNQPPIQKPNDYGPRIRSSKGRIPGFIAATMFLVLAGLIVSLPAKPIDVSHKLEPINLPTYLGQNIGRALPLSPQERTYFTMYGGAAVKKQYGPNILLLVRTTAPLRHLHGPDECLRGMGFKVRYVGAVSEILPAAVYEARSPQGQKFRVAATFTSAQGRLAISPAQAIWHWMAGDRSAWSALVRITPWKNRKEENLDFERGLAASLDLPVTYAEN